MNKKEKEFNDKFIDSEAFVEWHKSLCDFIDYIDDIINPDIPRMSLGEKKERIKEIKLNHLIKSIRLGKFYRELNRKEAEK